MQKTIKALTLGITLSLGVSLVFASDEPTSIIDKQTAGSLPKGTYSVNARLFGNGGLQNEIKVGITNRLMIGIGYGASGIIGRENIDWFNLPGAFISYRLFEENKAFPAFSLGFNSQGYGAYNDDLERFEVKSMGFYAAASKNYFFLGNLGLHAGANLSLENKDEDKGINFFGGFDKSLNNELTILAEYDFGLNDNKTKDGNYLNAGLKWDLGNSFQIEFFLKDILKNGGELNKDEMVREIRLTFYNSYN
ncbi:MAG: hypothetical protein DWQ06_06215 [Calditrichaeota bacterium]|nr:MAG: hypothetical protein DWQ06_06215 [Calditrichota bacterium]